MASARFHVLPATLADYEKIAGITMRAFENDSSKAALFPDRDKPQTVKDVAGRLEKSVNENHTIMLKAVLADSASGEERIIGVGQWLPPDQKGVPVTEAPEGSDKEMFMKFSKMREEKQLELLGDRPHYYCKLIAIDPDFHRQGAGGILVQWGTREADEHGVPSYIEATPAGLGLYERLGFVERGVLVFEDRKGHVNRVVCLVREPVLN